eukprot:TRINITY_DN94798_c0_g1_i1.p1 TRINITY_DN94798_c0_g1~~TRINITY_DN94798_c0_g1_i1.p1  ORF type:complete len:275 (-),score=48.42 TRINITY_DN94798_c0_g1_i1:5-829(-)
MHLLPTHNLESLYVRAFFKPHCDTGFQDLVATRWQLVETSATEFRVVEVGANLGGCIFHAMTHLGDSARGLAIEPYEPAAAALRRTAAVNGLDKQLAVDSRFICVDSRQQFTPSLLTIHSAWQHQTQWDLNDNGSAISGAKPCASLAAVLQEHGIEEVDILRVHVLGRELEVLRSAEPLLASGRVKAMAVAVLRAGGNPNHGQDILGIVRLLRSHGYYLEYLWGELQDDAVLEEFLLNSKRLPDGTSVLFAQLDPPRQPTGPSIHGHSRAYFGR